MNTNTLMGGPFGDPLQNMNGLSGGNQGTQTTFAGPSSSSGGASITPGGWTDPGFGSGSFGGVSAGSSLFSSGAGQLSQMMGGLTSAAMSGKRDAVNQASVDAKIASNNATGSAMRGLSRMGVNPNSGRFAGLMQEKRLEGAALETGAMTRAERAATEQQFSQLMQIAGLAQSQESLGASMMNSEAARAQSASQWKQSQQAQTTQDQARWNEILQATGGDLGQGGGNQQGQQQNAPMTTYQKDVAIQQAKSNGGNTSLNNAVGSAIANQWQGQLDQFGYISN